MTPTLILALMLLLQPPGATPYSVVTVPADSPPAVQVVHDGAVRYELAGDALPPSCSQRGNVACSKPQWSVRRQAHVRIETWREGLRRYWTIARAVAAASPDAEIARLVLASSFHESGFRRDVHEGIGRHAKGDGGRSWCLMQQMLGLSGRKRTRTNVPAYALVGAGPKATRRCIGAGVHDYALARERCTSHGQALRPVCAFALYGGLPSSTKHKGIHARGATYERIAKAWRDGITLEAEARAELGLPAEPQG